MALRAARFTMLGHVALAVLAISMGSTQVAVFAAEPPAPRPPGLAAAVAESEPPTDRAHADPVSWRDQ